MKVLVDIHDTMQHLLKHVVREHNMRYRTSVDIENVTDWLAPNLPQAKELFTDPDINRYVTPIHGAGLALTLIKPYADITIVSSSLCPEDTDMAFTRDFPYLRNLERVYVADKLPYIEQADIVVDDAPHVLIAARNNYKTACGLKTPYNSHLQSEDIRLFDSWYRMFLFIMGELRW